jgi:cytochrome c-type biogenesis protein
LSMLPITLGYMGGYAAAPSTADSQSPSRWQTARQSLWFAAGLATMLTLLGMGAALLGRVYGQVGLGLPIVVSAIAILMGLNLLEVVPFRLPGLNLQVPDSWPRGVRAYALGVTFGLIASPCSTPVLATLLAWISKSGNPLLGGVLLLCYALGYVSPLVLAGIFAGSLKRLLSLRQWSGWINPVSGVLLIGFGLFSLLTRLFPTF